MHVLIAYESMFGNTHRIAERVAAGFGVQADVCLVSIHHATPDLVRGADFVIIGGPTHAHSLSSAQSRQGARDIAARSGGGLHLDSEADGLGLRDWFRSCPDVHRIPAAAFDTRYDASPVLTGRAARGIARRLEDRGFRLVVEPESFLVTHSNVLVVGEEERALGWGIELAESLIVPKP